MIAVVQARGRSGRQIGVEQLSAGTFCGKRPPPASAICLPGVNGPDLIGGLFVWGKAAPVKHGESRRRARSILS